MKPVTQTKRGGAADPPEERGDCFDACLASILEVDLAECHVEHGDGWWKSAEAAAGRHGHIIFEPYRHDLQPDGSEPLAGSVLGGWIGQAYWIATVPSLNLPGERHVIVMRGVDVAHDPSIGGTYPLGALSEDVPIFDAIVLLPIAAPVELV